MTSRVTNMIESQLKEQVFSALEEAGLEQGSGDYQDYSRAKGVVFRSLEMKQHNYDRLLEIICEYLGV